MMQVSEQMEASLIKLIKRAQLAAQKLDKYQVESDSDLEEGNEIDELRQNKANVDTE